VLRASSQSESGKFASKSIAEMSSAIHSPISLLCYTILLWSIPSSVAPVDAAFICEFDKCIGHVFPSLVILELWFGSGSLQMPCRF